MRKFRIGQLVQFRSDKNPRLVIGIDLTDSNVYPYLISDTDLKETTFSEWIKSQTFKFEYLQGVSGDIYVRLVNEDELSELKPEPSTTVDESDVWVRRFKSGAVRSDDRGRENPAFISPYALKFLAQHFSKNAAFFNSNDSAKNYMKGIEPVDIEGSLARHYVEFGFAMMPNRRENIGPIKQALVEIMANCVMGLHQIGLAEDGEYVELFTKTEYIKKEE